MNSRGFLNFGYSVKWLTVTMFFSVSAPAFAERGIDISGNYEFARYIATPAISLSYMSIAKKHINEFSVEYGSHWVDKGTNDEEFGGVVGASYSFLARLGRSPLYMGPCAGYIYFTHYRNVPYAPWYSSTIDYRQIESISTSGLAGLKTAIITGTRPIQFRIQHRFLLGIQTEDKDIETDGNYKQEISLAMMNSLTIGIAIVF